MMRATNFLLLTFLFAGATVIDGNGIKGRLLTPEEGCGYSKVINPRIIGGSEAKHDAWPWMALLIYVEDVNVKYDCGGSLITSRHVLTAAHCVKKGLTFVRFAEHDIGTRSDGDHEDFLIRKSVKHGQHNDDSKVHDIAMLYLERDVEFSDRIHPVCLPLDEALLRRDFVGDNPFVAGWGSTTLDGDPSQVLKQLQVQLIDHKKCKRLALKAGTKYANVVITERVICAELPRTQRVWFGDSGGPLMVPIHQNGSFPFYQIGVVSFSYISNNDIVPGIFSSTQYYADWIKDHIEKYKIL